MRKLLVAFALTLGLGLSVSLATPLDTDNDTWSNVSETAIGTSPASACGVNAWPADLNNDTISDGTDLTTISGSFGLSVPPAPARHDVAPDPPDGFVDGTDLIKVSGFFGQTCIWKPALYTSWQWQLTGTLDLTLDVDMYDVDMFSTSEAQVAVIHDGGAKAVCYISAGSWENWRPDAGSFPASVKGRNNGWPQEKWLDIRNLTVLGPIMEARLNLCVSKGFDGVEFDNVDGYSNNTGFPLTYAHQITYNTFLANEAHERGLSAGLKNDVEQVVDLLPFFDWALNEECFQYEECDTLLPFIQAGKAVFEVEYGTPTSQFCPQANAMNFNAMRKHLDLDAFREPCR